MKIKLAMFFQQMEVKKLQILTKTNRNACLSKCTYNIFKNIKDCSFDVTPAKGEIQISQISEYEWISSPRQ